MHLVLAAILSFSSSAQAGCQFPCLGIGIGIGGTIIPDDWYELSSSSLSGELNWYRVELSTRAEFRSLIVGDYELTERFYSVEESDETVDVYYVPATRGGRISADGAENLWLGISGAAKPNL